ncbi:hypothetical protein TELCIR_00815 [Teladorsagia circumcincta]|uniref:Uncharacterized protein n=1 Tax=Teladorsagia circumcincta TaxID=45464 RepID=A0A2G9V3M9_TELCI|nr:hypothetical protein TELCIR_00815 [Teladorsagia circumcincta]
MSHRFRLDTNSLTKLKAMDSSKNGGEFPIENDRANHVGTDNVADAEDVVCGDAGNDVAVPRDSADVGGVASGDRTAAQDVKLNVTAAETEEQLVAEGKGGTPLKGENEAGNETNDAPDREEQLAAGARYEAVGAQERYNPFNAGARPMLEILDPEEEPVEREYIPINLTTQHMLEIVDQDEYLEQDENEQVPVNKEGEVQDNVNSPDVVDGKDDKSVESEEENECQAINSSENISLEPKMDDQANLEKLESVAVSGNAGVPKHSFDETGGTGERDTKQDENLATAENIGVAEGNGAGEDGAKAHSGSPVAVMEVVDVNDGKNAGDSTDVVINDDAKENTSGDAFNDVDKQNAKASKGKLRTKKGTRQEAPETPSAVPLRRSARLLSRSETTPFSDVPAKKVGHSF